MLQNCQKARREKIHSQAAFMLGQYLPSSHHPWCSLASRHSKDDDCYTTVSRANVMFRFDQFFLMESFVGAKASTL